MVGLFKELKKTLNVIKKTLMNFEKFSVVDRIILRAIFLSKNPIRIYEFHEKYLFSPGQLSRFVHKFQPEEIIQIKKEEVALTPKGKLWVFNNRLDIFVKNIDKTWRTPNERVLIKRIEPFSLYTPKDKNLDSGLIHEYSEDT